MQFVPSAWKYAIPLGIIGIVLLFVLPPAGLVGIFGAVGILFFFRDPDRSIPDTGIVSPADGRVSVIRETEDGIQIGVYMGVSDVHVNRAPLSGCVRTRTHRSGGHRPAFSKDSEYNERVRYQLETTYGPVFVDQIAGSFARRITPYVAPDENIERGQRIGHIAFGSRADVTIPTDQKDFEVTVAIGDSVRAGESILLQRTEKAGEKG